MTVKSISVRIDSEMLDKLHYIADYEGRSANGQIVVLIRKLIEEDEAGTAKSRSSPKIRKACTVHEKMCYILKYQSTFLHYIW